MTVTFYISLIGLIGSLILFAYLVSKGITNYFCIWLTVGLVALTSGLKFYDAYVTTFMQGMFNYMRSFYFCYIMVCIMGALAMKANASGVIAKSLVKAFGKNALLGYVILMNFLGFFGLGPQVLMITILPIATTIFAANDIPRRFIVAATFSFAFTALFVAPFSPGVGSNLIVTQALGVPLYAGAINGLIGTALMFTLQWFFFSRCIARAKAKGECFVALEGDFIMSEEEMTKGSGKKEPSLIESVLPFLCLTVLMNLKDVLGYRNEFGYFVSFVLAIIIYGRYLDGFKGVMESMNEGLQPAFTITLVMGSMVGFGSLITTIPIFNVIKTALFAIPGPPLVSASVAINVMAAITASSTSSLNIVAPTLGLEYVAMGVPAGNLARVLAFGSVVFDTMPYSGVLLIVMQFCRQRHKGSFGHIAVLNIVIPLIVLIVVVTLFTLLPNLP